MNDQYWDESDDVESEPMRPEDYRWLSLIVLACITLCALMFGLGYWFGAKP